MIRQGYIFPGRDLKMIPAGDCHLRTGCDND